MAKKKLKTKIRFMSHEYDLSFEPELEDTGGRLFGTSNVAKQQIKVCSGHSESITGETLLHELVHVVAKELDVKLEERSVIILGAGLYHFLHVNGMLDFSEHIPDNVPRGTKEKK